MRLFIAIEISDEIKDVLARVESHLQYAGADIKWINPKTIHLTIRFLGEVDEKRVGEVTVAVDSATGSAKPFTLSLNGLGGFPSAERPKVLWIGLREGAAEAAELAARIDDSLLKIGFAKEPRPFTAHLTLGRARSAHNVDKLNSKLVSASSIIGESAGLSQKAGSAILFRSELTPHGAVHTKIHESPFSG